MDSIAEIIEALRDGSLLPAGLAEAVDDVTMSGGFDSAEALSTLERNALSGEIDAELSAIIRDRIQSEPEPDESATVFQAAAPPPTPPTPTPTPPEDATQIAPPPDGTLTKGSVIKGRFNLEELLGSGGMGDVYKATDVRKLEAQDRNPYVAIKILNKEFGARPDALMTLQREARRAQSLAHPNIVRVYDFDRDGETIYLTMEYLKGHGLDHFVRASGFRGMPHDEALKMVNQIGDALAFAHDHDIAHCDLKPGNIFVTEDGQIKVIDFGIARPAQKPDENAAEVTLFDAGTIGALTPAYASPELIEENLAGAASDIFALAVVICEIFGGVHPFDRIESLKARDRKLEATMPGGLSRTQEAALRAALEFDPAKRTATVRELLDGLNAAPKSSGLRTASLTALALAVALVVGGATIYYDRIEQAISNLTARTTPATPTAPGTGAPARPGVLTPDQIEAKLTSPAPALTVATPDPAPAAPVVTDPVLKQVGDVFEDFPCGQLHAVRNGASIAINGYLHPAGLAKLKAAVLKLDAVSSVTADTHPVSDHQCELMRMIAPFVARNRLDRMGLEVTTRNPTGEFKAGEKLVIRFRTPKMQTHLYIDYYSLDGGVMHMLPDPNFASIPVAPNLEQALGDDPSAVQWTVGPPFGVELIIALAIPTPLFETPRPELEQGTVYLKDLKGQLRKIVRRTDSPPLAAAFVFLKTSPAN